jgi:hypothetical protein
MIFPDIQVQLKVPLACPTPGPSPMREGGQGDGEKLLPFPREEEQQIDLKQAVPDIWT